VRNATPVHSLLLVEPSMSPGVRSRPGDRTAGSPLPAHSTKQVTVREGSRRSSSSLNTVARWTRPCTSSSNCSGSTVGIPA
jgi:hypothetical protein